MRGSTSLSLSFFPAPVRQFPATFYTSLFPALVRQFPATFYTSFFERFAEFGRTYLHEVIKVPVPVLVPVLLACPYLFNFFFFFFFCPCSVSLSLFLFFRLSLFVFFMSLFGRHLGRNDHTDTRVLLGSVTATSLLMT